MRKKILGVKHIFCRLGLDLSKIKEGPAEVEPIIHESSTPSDEESNPIEDISNLEESNDAEDLDATPQSLRFLTNLIKLFV